MSEEARVLKEVLVLTGDGSRVAKVADLAGVSRDTVYAQCDARCHPSARILAAAYYVTKDTRIKAALTPPGHDIVLREEAINPTKSTPEELADVLPELGRWTELIMNPGSDHGEADVAKAELIREIEEAHKAFKQQVETPNPIRAVGTK